MNKPRLMTQTEFATHRGVGRSAVSNWKKDGLVVFAEGDDGRPMVDVERTDARLNRKIDPARGRPSKAAGEMQGELPVAPAGANAVRGGDSLADVRTDLIRAQTIRAQLDNGKRAGELVMLEDFTRRAMDYARVSRERMMSIVRTQAEWLAAAKDPRAIVAKLEDEIDRAFEDLATQIETGVVVEAVDDAVSDEDVGVAAEIEAALADREGEELEAAG